VPVLELFGTACCPHTRDMREWLEWRGCDFIEHDIDADRDAAVRLRQLTTQRLVPVLVEDGKVIEVGWRGSGCVVT